MLLVMNATAQASAASISGPKLDNRRVVAALVDLAIVLAGTAVILFAADALSADSGEFRGALGAVILGWALYYHFAMESGDGQTVGKRLMKLRVVLVDGRPAGMREVGTRTVLRVVDGIGGYIVGLIVMLATGQRRQRLGDLAARTMVVDASPTPCAPPASVAVPVEETVEDEGVEDEPLDSITLPSRPARPATLADLAAPEAPAMPETRPFDPPLADDVAVEPVEDEVVEPVRLQSVEEEEPVATLTIVADVEDEVEDEPAAPLAIVEVHEPVEGELAAELPDVSTPSLEEPAYDVVAVRPESSGDEPADEPMRLRSVETVSAIDLVMGAAADDDSPEQDQAPEGPAAS